MFAFVIYDTKTRELVAARDRFGIKPLYYYNGFGKIIFASEIKQFTVLPNWKSRLVQSMKDQFLLSGLIDTNEFTMFLDVMQVQPGHYMKFKANGNMDLEQKQWYDLKQHIENSPTTSTFLTLQWMLKCSVESHLQSDVPVGSCLSGGIDSTSIVCLVNRIKKSQKQVTISNRSIAEFDEGHWVDIVEQYCKDIERHDVFPDVEELFEIHPKLVYHQDSPIASTSMFAQWKVFEEARKHVTVMLDGQGSDEVFAGYHMFFGARFASLLRGGHLYTLFNEMNSAKKIPGYDQTFTIKCAASSLKNYPTVFDYSYDQVTRTSLPALLHWEDRDSMAHSIEARVPFLDHTLVEHMMALPEEKKISNGVTKVILREAMHDLIPEEIVNRKDKIGFQTPERWWFEHRTDLFLNKYRGVRKILPQQTKSRCDEIFKKRKPYTYEVWRAISFGEFIKAFEVEI
jgi:asparagine synthase (glutamine-hydrolysing)